MWNVKIKNIYNISSPYTVVRYGKCDYIFKINPLELSLLWNAWHGIRLAFLLPLPLFCQRRRLSNNKNSQKHIVLGSLEPWMSWRVKRLWINFFHLNLLTKMSTTSGLLCVGVTLQTRTLTCLEITMRQQRVQITAERKAT